MSSPESVSGVNYQSNIINYSAVLKLAVLKSVYSFKDNTVFFCHQLKSNPSSREEQEAQSQLKKSDEIQRLVSQAQSDFKHREYSSAASHLDIIIDVSSPPLEFCSLTKTIKMH